MWGCVPVTVDAISSWPVKSDAYQYSHHVDVVMVVVVVVHTPVFSVWALYARRTLYLSLWTSMCRMAQQCDVALL